MEVGPEPVPFSNLLVGETYTEVSRAILIRARDRVKAGWSQQAFARDGEDRPTSEWSPTAVRWDAMGSVWAVGGTLAEINFLRSFLPLGSGGLLTWNDDPERSPEQVIQLFDDAISVLTV
ncbi:DUF6197 family protein [Terrihabitans soli]